MPSTPLPKNPSIEHLKAQAKLVRDLIRDGDAGGLSMLDEFHPRLRSSELDVQHQAAFKTADAQLLVARLYGFPSWSQLRKHVALVAVYSFSPTSGADPIPPYGSESLFLANACLDYATTGPSPQDRIASAHALLEEYPTVVSGSLAALATVGDSQALANALSEDGSAIDKPYGPNQWPLLLYTVYSRIASDRLDWSTVETVKVLLALGADPNAGFL